MDFWEQLGAVIFDMDGVIFIGKRLRAGVIELVDRLTSIGIDFHILTNTGASTAAEIAFNLGEMGLEVEPQRITTSSVLTAAYVAQRADAHKVFTLGGGTGLSGALQIHGIEIIALERLSMEDVARISVEPGQTAIPLIVGWTDEYGHELATKVLRLQACISDVYAASADRSYPVHGGLLPGVLWLSSSVGALLGKAPFNPAKPNPYALRHVLGLLREPASRVTLIGDSVSDIQSGNDAGCRTVLILGGSTPRAQVAELTGQAVPRLVIEELTDLL